MLIVKHLLKPNESKSIMMPSRHHHHLISAQGETLVLSFMLKCGKVWDNSWILNQCFVADIVTCLINKSANFAS